MGAWWRRTGKRWIFHNAVPIVVGALVVAYAVVGSWDPSFPVDGSRIIAIVLWSGITSMVVVETIKRLIPLRGFYQRRETGLWLQRRDWQARRRRVRRYSTLVPDETVRKELAEAAREIGATSDQRARHDRIRAAERLISDWEARSTTAAPGTPSAARKTSEPRSAIEGLLAALNIDSTAGRRSGAGVGTVFNLPAEQLAAQISGAVESACQDPVTYRRLLEALDKAPQDPETGPGGTGIPDPVEEIDAERAMRLSQAVDELQIHLAGRWRHYVRATTWWLAAVIGSVLAALGTTAGVHTRLAVLACLVLGGFVAWTARDLTAVVERARR